MGKSKDFRNLRCNIECCDEKFLVARDYENHMRGSPHNRLKGTCFICGIFDESSRIDWKHRASCLRSMYRQSTGPKARYNTIKHVTTCCGVKFDKLHEYEKHLDEQHGNNGKCFICKEFDESKVIDYGHRIECFDKNWKESRFAGGKARYNRMLIDRTCCGITFARVCDYENHLREAHGTELTDGKCFICSDHDESSWINYDHRISCARRHFRCDDKDSTGDVKRYRKMAFYLECCNIALTNTRDLERHFRHNHSDGVVWTYDKCFLCKDQDELLTIDYDHRIECLLSRLQETGDYPSNLKYDETHDVWIDCSVVENTVHNSELYLNCKDCHEWLESKKPDERKFVSELPESIYEDFENFPENVTLSNNFELDKKCGIEAKWLILFEDEKYKFYHLMIRQQVWEDFCERCKGMEIYFSPYWCLCSGGNLTVTDYIHRHMIVAVDKSFDITKLVHGLRDWCDEKFKNRGSQSRLIKSYHHLMSAIKYVSNRSSQCDAEDMTKDAIAEFKQCGNFNSKGRKKKKKTGNCHFYINRQILPCSLNVMSFFNVAGIQAMANIKYGSISATSKLKNINGIEKMKFVRLRHLNVIRNHGIPQLKPLEHSVDYTDKRLELGPIEPGKTNIVRCFREIDSDELKYHMGHYYDNDVSYRMCNEVAARNGAIMFNFAMQSIYELNNQQKEILTQLQILIGKIDKMNKDHTMEKEALIAKIDKMKKYHILEKKMLIAKITKMEKCHIMEKKLIQQQYNVISEKLSDILLTNRSTE